MRVILSAAIALAIPAAALAQPARAPAAKPQPGKAPAAQAQPAPPLIFPCRTEQETCFLGIVVGSQVAVIFTNAQNAEALDAKPLDVTSADGAKTDLSPNAGRVVMLAGSYDPKTGIKGEVVEVASPLVSLSIKAQLGAGAPEAPGAGEPSAPQRPRR
jgi:hypothetical protein